MRVTDLKPKDWKRVVGQDRPIRILHGALRNQHAMTVGFIFEGSLGVGKTSTATLFAKSLLCMSPDQLNCPGCDSCGTNLTEHPDFKLVDAAEEPGVGHTRTIIEASKSPPILGRRKVIFFDEAHNLSPESWDAFLLPLESLGTEVVFLFVSNEGGKIPDDIVSRCTLLPFYTVDEESILGLLISVAEEYKIPFEMDGMRYIQYVSKGRVRNALTTLSMVASIGKVTLDLCRSVINNDPEDYSRSIFLKLLKGDISAAFKSAVELSERYGTKVTIDAMFTFFANQAFTKSQIILGFRSIHEVTSVFIKWSTPANLPSDALSLLLMELDALRKEDRIIEVDNSVRSRHVSRVNIPETSSPVTDEASKILTEGEFASLLGEKDICL